ncbi:MAG: hypothetical protein U0821_03750 [Chloroflexota bacterium]
MQLEDYLAVPYRLVAYSAPSADGTWKRYAELPELGCIAEADTSGEAMERVDRQRIQLIIERVRTGAHIPVPRPPLRSLAAVVELDRLDFARWLAETGQLNEGAG